MKADVGVIQSEAKECGQPQKLEEADFFPGALKRNQSS